MPFCPGVSKTSARNHSHMHSLFVHIHACTHASTNPRTYAHTHRSTKSGLLSSTRSIDVKNWRASSATVSPPRASYNSPRFTRVPARFLPSGLPDTRSYVHVVRDRGRSAEMFSTSNGVLYTETELSNKSHPSEDWSPKFAANQCCILQQGHCVCVVCVCVYVPPLTRYLATRIFRQLYEKAYPIAHVQAQEGAHIHIRVIILIIIFSCRFGVVRTTTVLFEQPQSQVWEGLEPTENALTWF